ncbi:MAG: hypothetical protein SOH97_04290 [Lactobacillus delbrueckii]|jgi:uncharacterized membrane protein
MKSEEEIARVELDVGLKEVDDGDKNEALAKLAFIFSLELMEKNNLSLTEQEGTQLGMALTTIMVNMTEHGCLTQEQLAQECKNILATYAFARMKKLMEEEFPSFEDDDYAHMASVQITVLADMLQSGILSYNDLYQETLEVIEQLLG